MRTLRCRRGIVPGLVIVAALILGGAVGQGDAPADSPRQVVVTVKGLACPFCAYGLEKHLRKLPGAAAVRVDLGKGEATIELAADAKVTEEQIRKAVKKAGFTADRIEWQQTSGLLWDSHSRRSKRWTRTAGLGPSTASVGQRPGAGLLPFRRLVTLLQEPARSSRTSAGCQPDLAGRRLFAQISSARSGPAIRSIAPGGTGLAPFLLGSRTPDLGASTTRDLALPSGDHREADDG